MREFYLHNVTKIEFYNIFNNNRQLFLYKVGYIRRINT